MSKKKGRSEKKTTLFGRTYIQHYDSEGNKRGTSERKTTLFGNSYTQHTDRDGNRTGKSERKTTLFGRQYTQKYDSEGNKSGTSEKKTTWLGNKYTQHYDAEGNKTDRSENKQTLFGARYVERYGEETRSASSGTAQSYNSSGTSSTAYGASAAGSTSSHSNSGPVIFLIVGALAAILVYKSGMLTAGHSTTATSKTSARIISIAGTRWQGKVGRAPASLEIFQQTTVESWKARLRYTGIAEDLAVRVNADGSLTLAGTGYRREAGVGPFVLDALSGGLSRDGRHLRGSLIDGDGRHGQWSLTKIEGDPASAIINVLDVDTAITHWQGTIGKAAASIDIFPRTATGEWTARGIYYGVVEDLELLVQDDGTLVFSGRRYQLQSEAAPFALSTFFGKLSSDGNRIRGLRIDAEGKRESWQVSQTRRIEQPVQDATANLK
ncbi:MAG TPA: hypothetical protein VGK36_13480 [Candidatus Angelobacter sp.]|jgi:hypothetical protein